MSLEEEKEEQLNIINQLDINKLMKVGFIQLRQIQKLADVAKIYKIKSSVIDYRLKFLEEGVDYIKLGNRQPTILTPLGVEKILNVKGKEL